MSRLPAIALIATLLACGPPPPESPDELPRPDYAEFTVSIQPIVAERCANPSCHGNSERPLSLYAPGAHRAQPDRVFFDEPLTDAELRANYDRARSFTVDGGAGPQLLTKPLAEDAGGIRHVDGEDVFSSPSDRDYQIIEEWVEGAR